MKNSFKEYFSFSGSERKGIITLIIILFFLILIWKILPVIKTDELSNTKEFEKEITDFEKNITKKEIIRDNSLSTDTFSHFFVFNPNNLSDSNWYALGLSIKQVVSIRHFQEKGGKFKTKEDFKKMYCLKSGQYDLLEPYIEIPSQYRKDSTHYKKANEFHKLNVFDPNCTSLEEWKAFGLTEKQINVIGNYISKGGKFKTKEDLKKIYCIQPHLYDQLEPYISIAPESSKLLKFDPDIRIDINKADSTEFRKIKGISPYLARNIIKYRNALGGFIQKKQILEVWGFKSDLYNNIEKNIFLSETYVKKINLNTTVFADMLKHPYLNYDLTKAIMQYRKIVGKINTIQELINNKIVPDSIIYKIKPYLLSE